MKGITKGEWYISDTPNMPNSPAIGIDCIDSYFICDVFNDYIHEEEAKANAQLICTAGNLTNAGYNIEAMPQLVEALEWSLYEFEKLADCGKFPEHLMVVNGGDGLMPIVKALKSAKNE